MKALQLQDPTNHAVARECWRFVFDKLVRFRSKKLEECEMKSAGMDCAVAASHKLSKVVNKVKGHGLRYRRSSTWVGLMRLTSHSNKYPFKIGTNQ